MRSGPLSFSLLSLKAPAAAAAGAAPAKGLYKTSGDANTALMGSEAWFDPHSYACASLLMRQNEILEAAFGPFKSETLLRMSPGAVFCKQHVYTHIIREHITTLSHQECTTASWRLASFASPSLDSRAHRALRVGGICPRRPGAGSEKRETARIGAPCLGDPETLEPPSSTIGAYLRAIGAQCSLLAVVGVSGLKAPEPSAWRQWMGHELGMLSVPGTGGALVEVHWIPNLQIKLPSVLVVHIIVAVGR